MRVRVHQLLVALPLTLVSALGIAVGVQSFSLESADLLSIAPADTALPLDAIRGSVEGVVPPPPARPAEPAPAPAAPAVRGITGFTAPVGAATAIQAAPASKVKAPAARTQRPKPAIVPRSAPTDSDCVPDDPTLRQLPNPTGVRRPVPRQRSVSDDSSQGSPLLPGAVPARTSAGLPASGSAITGSHPSTSRPGPSTSGPGPSISQPNPSAHFQGEPVRTPPQVSGCSSPDRGHPGSPVRRRVPVSEPVVARDGGLAIPARSGW
jgi:hypothetical protein